jgi:methanogenic corrinoid protein MtbC1
MMLFLLLVFEILGYKLGKQYQEMKQLNEKIVMLDRFVENNNRNGAVEYIIELVKNGLTIPKLYEGILAPYLAQIASNDTKQTIPIWKEHLKSSIIRTIVETMTSFIDSNGIPKNGHYAIVFCLEEEYHEIGARMASDFLSLLGFNTIFIGANTPKNEIFDAIEHFKPKIIAISVSSFYHIVKLKDITKLIREKFIYDYKIISGGYAIGTTKNIEDLGIDYAIFNFEELNKFIEGVI